nr:HAMP domain-containing sensor histidine kinase [Haloarchaeobius amylolyticus]
MAASVGYYVVDHDDPLLDALEVTVPFLIGAAIFTVGVRVVRRGYRPARVRRLTGWTVAGGVAGGLSLLVFSSIHTLDFGGQLVSAHLLLDGLTAGILGAGGGLVLGLYADRLTERTRELEAANERLDEFASMVSHDLRNPLTVATLSLKLARETGEEKRFDAVDRAHERMGVLVDELLVLARQGTDITDPVPTDVEVVAREAWDTVATEGATLVVGLERTVLADAERLRTLFENLYRNSIEHGRRDATVTIGETATGFFVEDDGPGIDVARRGEIFAGGYTTTEHGTGLGLSIVRRIARAHGWRVRVTDGSTGGARFEFEVRPGDGLQVE